MNKVPSKTKCFIQCPDGYEKIKGITARNIIFLKHKNLFNILYEVKKREFQICSGNSGWRSPDKFDQFCQKDCKLDLLIEKMFFYIRIYAKLFFQIY